MTDIILDSSSELIAKDGDFYVDDPANNYIYYLVASTPGDWKQYPLVGVGIYNFIQGVFSSSRIEQAIITQMKADVFQRPSVNARKFPVIDINGTQLDVGV